MRRLQVEVIDLYQIHWPDPDIDIEDGWSTLSDLKREGKVRNMKVAATWSETSVEPTRLAPRLNEHGAEVLREAGFSADEIAGLVRDGVTKAANATTQD